MTYLRSLLLFCKKYPHNIFIRYCIFSDFVRSLVLSCPNVSLCGYVELKNDDEELEALKRAAGSTSKSGIIFHNSRELTCQQIRRHDGRLCSLMTSRCSWKTWTGPRVGFVFPFTTCFICFQLRATPLDVLSFHRGDECVLQHHTPKKIKLFNTFLGGLNFVTAPEQTGDMLENLLRIMWYEMRTRRRTCFKLDVTFSYCFGINCGGFLWLLNVLRVI